MAVEPLDARSKTLTIPPSPPSRRSTTHCERAAFS